MSKEENSFDESVSSEFEHLEQEERMNDSPVKGGEFKCFKPFLSRDHSSQKIDGFQRLPCNNLICTQCDIKIGSFEQQKWKQNADYLFFRSNFGNPLKLKQQLLPDPKFTAYHCGCMGFSVDEAVSLQQKGVTWVCCGHNK